MVLVLGRPGSGCLSLLKKLSGTDLDSFISTSGDIRYDGILQSEMLKNFKSELIYSPELDVHMPHLTVEQTLKFAISCKIPNTFIDGNNHDPLIDTIKDILATLLGLRHTYETKVGNELVPGVSRGERKKISIAEALACQASFYCWDNATKGLDASSAFECAKVIRTFTNLFKTTAFVTIYQGGEDIYKTFDKVTILYLGRQIYFGPIERAKQFFETMGWECPPRQSTTDFLNAVTDPIGRFPRPGYESKVPHTAEEFEDYWLKSTEYKNLRQEMFEYKAFINEAGCKTNHECVKK